MILILKKQKENSILLHLHSDNQYYKYMFIGSNVLIFETIDKIVEYSSNLVHRVHFPAAYGENNIYFLVDRYEFIPYNTIEDVNIKEMN